MRKVIFAINITADGYCSHTDGIVDEQLHEYFTGLLRNAGILLYGRITYQLMVPYWPEVAKSQSESKATNEFARGNVAEEVLALKRQPGKDICVGSLSIASQLSERGLIDEYYFVVHPVIAGKGPRLFESVKLHERLLLDFVGSETFQSGVVAIHYRKHT